MVDTQTPKGKAQFATNIFHFMIRKEGVTRKHILEAFQHSNIMGGNPLTSGGAIAYYLNISLQLGERNELKMETKEFDLMTEEQQIEYVTRFYWNIGGIDSSSEAVQLAAVNKWDKFALQYIDKPSEVVQLAAVQRSGWAIEQILDNGIRPSNEVIFIALTHPLVLNGCSKERYDDLVKRIFPNNSLLAKKWIRYGDNHRLQKIS